MLPLLCLWLVPVVALAVVVPMAVSREGASVVAELPVTATVGSRENDYRQTVSATFTVTEPHDVLLPAAGLVTAVHATPGQTLAQTDAVVSVDGAVLRAHVDTAPFYREIGPGSAGDDVERLRAYLETAGHPSQPGRGSSYSRSLATAVTAYQKANGLTADGTFRPSAVVYVPPTATTVQSVSVAVGATVAAGDAMLAGPALPLSMAITAESPLKLAGRDGPFAFIVLDEDVPVSSLTPAPEEVVALYTAFVDASTRGGPTLTSDDTTQTFSGLMLHLPSAAVRGTVPTTAVLTGATGTRCVFLAAPGTSTPDVTDVTDAPDPSPTAPASATPSAAERAVAVPVDDAAPVDGEIGLASVQADLVGETVVRNPRSLPADVLAGCA